MQYQLGLIGAGNMAEAIIRAGIAADVLDPKRVIAADPTEQRRAVFAQMGVTVTEDNDAVIGQSEQIMLAVKPQTLPKIASHLTGQLQPSQIILSIMAGISTAKLASAIAGDTADAQAMRIVRIMPNTPMMVGQGMSAIATSAAAHEGDDDLAMQLFAAGGQAIRVDESLMDAITAVSGSGPAYVFYLAEAMETAASELGLGEHARKLVAQTLLGAAHLLCASPDTAAALRRKVTSPGGTTEAAINHMESQNVRSAIVAALHAADARSKELGK